MFLEEISDQENVKDAGCKRTNYKDYGGITQEVGEIDLNNTISRGNY